MKGKILLLLLPLTLAGCRGGDTPSADPSVNPSVAPSVNPSVEPSVEPSTGPNPYEITEEEWDSLVRKTHSFGEEVNATYVGNIRMNMQGQDYNIEVKLECDNGKYASYHKASSQGHEDEGTIYFELNKESYRVDDDSYEYVAYEPLFGTYRRNTFLYGDRRMSMEGLFLDAGFQFKDAEFSQATFDGEKYTLTDVKYEGRDIYTSASFKFENGKLVMFNANRGETDTIEYTGSLFGETTVTMPEEYANNFEGRFLFTKFKETSEEVPNIDEIAQAFVDAEVQVFTSNQLTFYSEKSYMGSGIVNEPTNIVGTVNYNGAYGGTYTITSMTIAGYEVPVPESGMGPYNFSFEDMTLVIEILISDDLTVHAECMTLNIR